MKRTVAAILILLVLTAGSLLHIRKMNRLIDSIIEKTEVSRSAHEKGDLTLAEKALNAAIRHWNSADTYTHVFLDHDKIQQIDDGFFDILASLPSDRKTEAETAYCRLLEKLAELCREEQLRPESIF